MIDEDRMRTKELYHELAPTMKKYTPYEICLVCMGIIVNLVTSAPVDEREELYTDIKEMMDTGIERLGK